VGLCQSFGLSHENAQDRDQWTLSIKGELANPGSPGKVAIKMVWCTCLCYLWWRTVC